MTDAPSTPTITPSAAPSNQGQAIVPSRDPLAPQHLDRELEQQVGKLYADAREKEKQKKEAEAQARAVERFDEVRKMGFLTQKDVDTKFAESENRMNVMADTIAFLKAEIAQLKSAPMPAQNSGALDDPGKNKKNPLWLQYR